MTKNGLEYVARAEELLDLADEVMKGPRCHLAKTYAQMAQANATLALAAATAKAADTADRIERRCSK